MQKLWMIRAGKNGEQEQVALDKGLATLTWNAMPDMSKFKDRVELEAEYNKHYSEVNIYALGNKVGQLFRFSHRVQAGDLVVMPSKFSPDIHIGEVTGKYHYEQITPEVLHWIPVKWKVTLSRSVFEEDLLFSFGSLLTLCNIKRNNALERVKALMEGIKLELPLDLETEDESLQNAETEELAYTRIEQFIQQHFKDYGLEDLVREILKAHGYTTMRSKEIGQVIKNTGKGADGGVDILASKGALGFESPRLCVQVKSGIEKLPPKDLRELIGVMDNFKAEYGMLVSWSGFSNDLIKESRGKYFTVRLWSSSDIIREVFEHYDKFSDEFKTRLPLKRIWVLEENKE